MKSTGRRWIIQENDYWVHRVEVNPSPVFYVWATAMVCLTIYAVMVH